MSGDGSAELPGDGSGRSAGRPSRVRSGMRCPRCTIRLQARRHELGLSWRCTACGGQSLNYSQFRRMVPEAGANSLWLDGILRPALPSAPVPCPECRAPMRIVPVPWRGREVDLCLCPACQRLWLDPPERPPSIPAPKSGPIGPPGLPAPIP